MLGGSAPAGKVFLEPAATGHLFGVVLFNDWSARDIQAFEHVPLGPCPGKSFASAITLWVVPWEALSAARAAPPAREHELGPSLDDEGKDSWGLDITLGVSVDGLTVSHSPASTMYWTAPRMVAHMSVNGAGLRPGDFFGSGTVSGQGTDRRGSFLELSWGGKEPFPLLRRHRDVLPARRPDRHAHRHRTGSGRLRHRLRRVHRHRPARHLIAASRPGR